MLAVEGVTKRFVTPLDFAARVAGLLGAGAGERAVTALDDVSLAINEREVVGLVGESGCGKSTLGRIIAGLVSPSAGRVRFHGYTLEERRQGSARLALLKIQMIFQDPMASLNPRMRVRDIIGEAPAVHGVVGKAEIDGYIDTLLTRVGLDPRYKSRYPHQFSGGQRARIGIARALAVKPEFLVCDELVASLDVSIKAQVLNLFAQLRDELGLTYLFISHDLGVVEHISQRTVIMYWRHSRGRPDSGAFSQPQPSLHPGAACQCAAPRSKEAPVQTHRRRDPLPARSSFRLSLPPALPVCDAALPSRASCAERDCARPLVGMPSQ